MNWLAEHWNNILEWIGGIVTFASFVVGMTPTKKDDGVWAIILKILDKFSVVNTPSNREKLK